MCRVLLLLVVCTLAIPVPMTAAESAFSHYRDIALGDDVQVVVDKLKVTLSDVKVVLERPVLIQQLTWRPKGLVSGGKAASDALSELVLTFHLGQLARIAVTYDREKTEGMTNADLHEAFTSTYGTAMLVGTPTLMTVAPTAEPETIARWGDGETLVLLWREIYPSRVRLTVTSIVAEQAVLTAVADGKRLEASQAPARDLARRTTEEAAIRARDEKVRRDNKASFKP